MPTSAANNGPDFSLRGPFNGKIGPSATRWLKKLEWELKRCSSTAGIIILADYLQAVDLLLADDAAVWAETTPGVAELLEDPDRTEDTLVHQGPILPEIPCQDHRHASVHFDSEISGLKQLEDESLIAYYKRTVSLLSRVGGRDRPRSMTAARMPALSPLEAAMLDTLMRSFTRGVRIQMCVGRL